MIVAIPEPDGEARRDVALSRLRTHRAVLVRELSRAAVLRALHQNEITADDVRAIVPIPPGIKPVVVGAAMRGLAVDGIIRRVGYRSSKRAIAHARPLAVWQLVDEAAAHAWLASHPAITTEEPQ